MFSFSSLYQKKCSPRIKNVLEFFPLVLKLSVFEKFFLKCISSRKVKDELQTNIVSSVHRGGGKEFGSVLILSNNILDSV